MIKKIVQIIINLNFTNSEKPTKMDKFKSFNEFKKKMGDKVDAAKKEMKDKYEAH